MKTCPVCGKEYPDDTKFCAADGSTLRAKSPTADLVGQVIADRYAIVKKLGEGGMGAVYRGEHVKMGRLSAIKVMNPAMAADPEAISRFNREALNASKISHPNVCQIYDFGETPDGIIYLAMEYIDGSTLTDIIEKEGALPPVRAVRILKQSADALAAAHDLAIVHRDLKPDNIMIMRGRDGADVVKVVDFGIAKAVAGDEAGQKVTKTGLVVGTPEYMSPEQLSGDKLDGRSDIYSLGLVFYRMLTGVLPFQADSAQETMIKRLTDEPLPLAAARPDITFPAALQAVLDKALARMPTERYANASQFGRDAEAAVGGMAGARGGSLTTAKTQLMEAKGGGATAVAPKAARAVPPTVTAPAARRFPLLPVVGGVAGVGVLAVVGWLAMGGGRKPAPAGTPDTTSHAAAPGGGGGSGTQAAPTGGGGTQAAQPPRQTATASKGVPPPPTGAPRETLARQAAPASASAVSVKDSLNAADSAAAHDQWDVAARIGEWVYGWRGSSDAERASGALEAATAYVQQSRSADAITWYHNVLRYQPNNQRVKDLITSLGGTP